MSIEINETLIDEGEPKLEVMTSAGYKRPEDLASPIGKPLVKLEVLLEK